MVQLPSRGRLHSVSVRFCLFRILCIRRVVLFLTLDLGQATVDRGLDWAIPADWPFLAGSQFSEEFFQD